MLYNFSLSRRTQGSKAGCSNLRYLICGDRNWDDIERIAQFISTLPPDSVIIEGEARGADSIARECALEMGLEVVKFPADWKKFGKGAGPIRNLQMITEGRPDVVVAFHNNLSASKGTKNMVETARKHGLNVLINPGL